MPRNRIENFIRKHHVMTLATVSDGRSWCAHVFYAWLPDDGSGAHGVDGGSGEREVDDGSGAYGVGGGNGLNGVDDGSGAHGVGNGSGAGRDDWRGADSVDDWRGGVFVFTTDSGTRHGAEMESCASVSAGIALETRTVGRLQGLQIEGTVRKAAGAKLSALRRAYLKRFPYAVVVELSLWVLEPSLMKLTDNTLGFGKKLLWVTEKRKKKKVPMFKI